MSAKIKPPELAESLVDGLEIALLDAREQGDFFGSHLFHAACVPLSHLELELPRLVTRLTTRIVWCDADGGDLAERALQRSTAMGYSDVSMLEGGTAAWLAWGGEVYSGVNVPSKAFGEHVEHTYQTPRIAASKLKETLDNGSDCVVLDSRPLPEFQNMSIPTAVDCPGAELVLRVKEMAPDPSTLVVVNCAGRTRSIIGAQSLINSGLENRVMALENGTMGWELAGYEIDRGQDRSAPTPPEDERRWARLAAQDVAVRFRVGEIDRAMLGEWMSDPTRTTFLLDVRTPQEFEAGHLPESVSAPGGQLVQATDEYVATRNARLVLVDDDLVRARMTASWLQQLGWVDAVVLAGGLGTNGLSGETLATGPAPRVQVPAAVEAATAVISVEDLATQLRDPDHDIAVIDIGTSLKYRDKGHVPGAYWGVRSRMAEAREVIGEVSTIVLCSTDGRLARLAGPDASECWPEATVMALAGGTRAWRHGEQPMEEGFTRPTTKPNDVWYKPYDHHDDVAEQHMKDYLTWEVALVDQIQRDPTISFPRFD